MTREGLTELPPPARNAICCDCGRPTYAPVPVRHIERGSGPGYTVYACPRCAPDVTPGPLPGEVAPSPSS
ncbi:hypothetical protein ACWD4V_24585 [Streptomyces tsukubensis]